MKRLYLALAFIGAVWPLSPMVPWLAVHGFDPALFLSQVLATPVSRFFAYDVLVSGVVVIALAGDGLRRGVRGAGWAIAATCVVGVSCGLPLYLYLAERAWEKGA